MDGWIDENKWKVLLYVDSGWEEGEFNARTSQQGWSHVCGHCRIVWVNQGQKLLFSHLLHSQQDLQWYSAIRSSEWQEKKAQFACEPTLKDFTCSMKVLSFHAGSHGKRERSVSSGFKVVWRLRAGLLASVLQQLVCVQAWRLEVWF